MTTHCWQPPNAPNHLPAMKQFILAVNNETKNQFKSYSELHHWSIHNNDQFWSFLLTWFQFQTTTPASQTSIRGSSMIETTWFPGLTFNFAQMLLQNPNNEPALIACEENGTETTITRQELQMHVRAMQQHLKQLGLKPGDIAASILPNGPEAIIAMLACSSLGVVWASASPDFGFNALRSRLNQVKPTLLFTCQSAEYNGKNHCLTKTIKQLTRSLPTLKQVICIDAPTSKDQLRFSDCLIPLTNAPIQFTPHPFDHPLYILFSSGTTGQPKCLVHGAGNTLLQHLKELSLHADISKKDRLFFYSTCGWMMWHWMVSALALETTLVLYSGSPYFPNKQRFLTILEDHQVTVFGAGAQYFDALCQDLEAHPTTHKLDHCRLILSTGSPLLPILFDRIQTWIKPDVQISSISGGSDIISCFALGNPLLPVYRGELQCLGLGMQVEVVNQSNQAIINETGELSCANPCPSMPIYFLNDPNNEKYIKAYFQSSPNRWLHGDYATLTSRQTLIIYGRSDATLNPGGVRIGTAEIYNACQSLHYIHDCLATGYLQDNDEKIILFLVLKNIKLEENLIKEIKLHIKAALSPRHVPSYIIAVPDIPKTMNGKTCEIVVKKIINKQPIGNQDALLNPNSLDVFKSLVISN